MNVISLKEYAKQNNISYEAVRQQVVRYADELGEHLIRDGRQQFLDEEAVTFLDAKRQKNPVTIIQMDKDEQIETLRQEKETLLLKVAEQATQISDLAKWKADKAVEIAEANQKQRLLAAGEEKIKALAGENDILRRNVDLMSRTLEGERSASQKLSGELSEARIDYDKLKERNQITENNLRNAQEQLSKIQNTWWYKLFGGKRK